MDVPIHAEIQSYFDVQKKTAIKSDKTLMFRNPSHSHQLLLDMC